MKTQLLRLIIFLWLTFVWLLGWQDGSYGSYPPHSDSLSELMEVTSKMLDQPHYDLKANYQIKSLFMRPQGRGGELFLALVAQDADLTQAVRTLLAGGQTPLVFSVSTLPSSELNFNPTRFRFEQNGRVWQPGADSTGLDLFPLGKNAIFGGLLNDGQIHQGIIMLPEWFDLTQPITVKYGADRKRLLFD